MVGLDACIPQNEYVEFLTPQGDGISGVDVGGD
jgi:hypothetical protein